MGRGRGRSGSKGRGRGRLTAVIMMTDLRSSVEKSQSRKAVSDFQSKDLCLSVETR